MILCPADSRSPAEVVLVFLLDWKCVFLEFQHPPYLLGMLFAFPQSSYQASVSDVCLLSVTRFWWSLVAAFWKRAQLIHITWRITCWSFTHFSPYPLLSLPHFYSENRSWNEPRHQLLFVLHQSHFVHRTSTDSSLSKLFIMGACRELFQTFHGLFYV